MSFWPLPLLAGVLLSLSFVCLSVSTMTKKGLVDFNEIVRIGRLWTRGELVNSWS